VTDAPLHRLGLREASGALATGAATARELAESSLERIAATDARIEAWAHLEPDAVRAAADCCDAVQPAERGPLHGIGIGGKDVIATADMPTQMGSPVHAGHRPVADAACVSRLQAAGGYVFGKAATTSDAFPDPGKTRHPGHPAHPPGGPSAGSAPAHHDCLRDIGDGQEGLPHQPGRDTLPPRPDGVAESAGQVDRT